MEKAQRFQWLFYTIKFTLRNRWIGWAKTWHWKKFEGYVIILGFEIQRGDAYAHGDGVEIDFTFFNIGFRMECHPRKI